MALRRNTACRALAMALTAALFLGLGPAPAAHALNAKEIRTRLYKKVNDTRAKNGLRRLRVNDKTQYWAGDHARWLSRNCKTVLLKTCHDSEDELWDEVPSNAEWRGENLAFASQQRGIVSLIHSLFMNSLGHCKNVLRRRATHMGFGVVKDNGRVYVVQRFVDRKRYDGVDPLGLSCNWL